MRHRYVASTSLRRHVPAGNLPPLTPPHHYSKPWSHGSEHLNLEESYHSIIMTSCLLLSMTKQFYTEIDKRKDLLRRKFNQGGEPTSRPRANNG